MGLHDRIKGPNGNGANGNGHGAEPHASLAAAAPRDAGADRSSVDPYAELKTRIHHACIAKLGPQLFSSAEPTADLSRPGDADGDRAARARPDSPHAGGAPADHARDRRRHPRLRAARAVPAGRHRDRGHGQQLRPDLRRAERARSSARRSAFADNAHLLRIIDKIVSQVGRRIDESSPMVDARLPDGSRVNAIIPPLALRGPDAHDPEVRPRPVHDGRPDHVRLDHAQGVALPLRLRAREAERPHLRRYRHR